MGVIKLFSKGNPNPNNFTIIGREDIGKYIVVQIRYPDAITFEGDKILVYRTDVFEKLIIKGVIDPHFVESKECPIARFIPTLEGWGHATRFVRQLVESGKISEKDFDQWE